MSGKLPSKQLAGRLAAELRLVPEEVLALRETARAERHAEQSVQRALTSQAIEHLSKGSHHRIRGVGSEDFEVVARSDRRLDLARESFSRARWASLIVDSASTPIPIANPFTTIPVIPEGVDPDRDVTQDEPDTLRVNPDVLRSLERLENPFALELSPSWVLRTRGLLPPTGIAIVSRHLVLLFQEDEFYLVRHSGRPVLGRVQWNGTHLLVPASEGRTDFLVLEAQDEAEVRGAIIGTVVVVIAQA